MKQNKKGVSDVVASVLMIMLVIVAIGIIYSFVVPFVKNSLQKSTECLSYKESYLFDESFPFNCYSSIESTYKFSVKANLDDSLAENVGGLKLVLVDQNGLTKILEIKDGGVSSKSENGIWVMGDETNNLRVPKRGGTITYGFTAPVGSKFVSAEVYPFLKSDRICADSKESINLREC